jgi:hypothetical protein
MFSPLLFAFHYSAKSVITSVLYLALKLRDLNSEKKNSDFHMPACLHIIVVMK